MTRTLTALACLFACLLPGTVTAQDWHSQTGVNARAWGDCGACAMATYASFYGLTFTCDDLHYGLFDGNDVMPGIGFDEMAARAAGIGIPVRVGYYATVQDVAARVEAGQPVGVYIFRRGQGHVIVVYGRSGDGFAVFDPGGEVATVDAAFLNRQFAASGGRVWW